MLQILQALEGAQFFVSLTELMFFPRSVTGRGTRRGLCFKHQQTAPTVHGTKERQEIKEEANCTVMSLSSHSVVYQSLYHGHFYKQANLMQATSVQSSIISAVVVEVIKESFLFIWCAVILKSQGHDSTGI